MGLLRSWFSPTRTTATLSIPDGPSLPLTVVTLVTTKDPFNHAGELYYLQAIRQLPWLLEGELMAARCQVYLDNVAAIAAQLVSAAGAQECDAMLGVPTTRMDLLRPYLDAAQATNPDIVEVTGLVHRDPDAGSTCTLSFTERQSRHELTGPLPVMQRLLILDDFLASGASVAHIIELIRQHTTAMPEVVVAAPLWVPVDDPAAGYLR